jgi:nitrogen fixation protein FixH
MTGIRIRKFTGWHMFAILFAFFGVVVSVNMVMATAAMRTFGGTVVDNSYVASQRFNGWLAEARAQERLGWTTRLGVDEGRHVTVALGNRGTPLAGAEIEAVARHPLGRAPDVILRFQASGAGAYISQASLPAGRWLVHVEIRSGGRDLRLIETLS